MIPIQTPKGTFRVWTKRTGNNPRVKVLLLHGGPAMTHEYFEAFDSWFPGAGIEFYYYDQLGSYYSDQPDDPGLWTVERFRSEVEEVRTALGLEGFFLFGNSWGGMLGIEYALQHQEHLRGLVVSNMTASIAAYVKHVNELRDRLPRALVEEMGRRRPNARVHVCENGSHMPFWDDAEDYFAALWAFIRDVESGALG